MKLDMAIFRNIVISFEKFRQFGQKSGVAGFEIRFVRNFDGDLEDFERIGASIILLLGDFGHDRNEIGGLGNKKMLGKIFDFSVSGDIDIKWARRFQNKNCSAAQNGRE